jgi:hypothetical protein
MVAQTPVKNHNKRMPLVPYSDPSSTPYTDIRLITLTSSTSMLLTSSGVQKRYRKKTMCIAYRSAADMNLLGVENINLWLLAPGSELTQACLFWSLEGKYYA